MQNHLFQSRVKPVNKPSEDTPEASNDNLEGIARNAASPIILRILRNFSAEDVTQAIEEDVGIVDWLKENPRVLWRLRLILMTIPFVDNVAPYITDKKWLRWFIANEMKHERFDLHSVFTYHPQAFQWLHKSISQLSEFLFGEQNS